MSVRPSASGHVIRFILCYLLPFMCLGTALWPLWDEYGLIPELLGQARLYLTFVYVAVLLLLLWQKGRFSSLCMVLLIGFNIYWMYSSFHMTPQTSGVMPNVPHDSVPKLRMFSFNIYKDNATPDAITPAVLRLNPDVILLIEAEHALGEHVISQLTPYYPFRYTMKESKEPMSLALLSKYPFTAENRSVTHTDGHKVLYADIDVNGQHVQFYGIHPLSPKNADRALTRNIQLRHIAIHILTQSNADVPLIVAGDFNTAPWQNSMRDFTYLTGLINTDNFWDMTLTWPTWLPPFFGVPIDHILHNSQLCSTRKQKLPATGSDHYPVWTDLYFCQNGIRNSN